jgi:hypothetical protein
MFNFLTKKNKNKHVTNSTFKVYNPLIKQKLKGVGVAKVKTIVRPAPKGVFHRIKDVAKSRSKSRSINNGLYKININRENEQGLPLPKRNLHKKRGFVKFGNNPFEEIEMKIIPPPPKLLQAELNELHKNNIVKWGPYERNALFRRMSKPTNNVYHNPPMAVVYNKPK